MNQVRSLVFAGEVNVQIYVNKQCIVGDHNILDKPLLNLRFPRNTFLPMYLGSILSQLEFYLKDDVAVIESRCWFTFENLILPWFSPIGSLFDMTMTNEIIFRTQEKQMIPDKSIINIWPITLHYSIDGRIPRGLIPLIDGDKQIEVFWMHRWKQACFIMNGSSKLMMSLTRNESVAFWQSLKNLDMDKFHGISSKMIPPNPSSFRMVPIQFHYSSKGDNTDKSITPIQPVVKSVQDNELIKLEDVIKTEFPNFVDSHGQITIQIISQGIIIKPEETVYELYTSLSSIDGFLHIILVT